MTSPRATGTFFRKLVAAAVLLLPVLLMRPANSGPGTVYTYFPTASTSDSRMLSLAGVPLQGMAAGTLSVEIGVPAGQTSFEVGIFDGDTGKDRTGSSRPDRGFWDLGTAQLEYSLYADPKANTKGTKLVGRWLGNSKNKRSGSGWTDSAATMPDNDWWTATVKTSTAARNANGNYFYRLVVRLTNTRAATSSNFKLRSTGVLSILPAEIGIAAALAQPFNDGRVVYPEWDGHTIPGAGSNFWLTTRTTYDGRFDIYVDVPAATEFTMWDGDADFGTGTLTTSPSNQTLIAASDTHDLDTSAFPAFAAGTAAVAERAVGSGDPEEDSHFDLYRRSPTVTYRVLDPVGNSYRNANPSGNREWEQFRITTSAAAATADSDYSPTAAADGVTHVAGSVLPAGTYHVQFAGLDLQNLTYLHFPYSVMSVDEAGNPVPPLPGRSPLGTVAGKGSVGLPQSGRLVRATYTLNVTAGASGTSGSFTFSDPRQSQMNVTAATITGVAINGPLAVITGTAQVNGAGSFPFVLEVTDPGKKGDTLTLRIDGLAQGYSASGVVQKKGTIGITTS